MVKKRLKNLIFVSVLMVFLAFLPISRAQACGSGLSISSIALSTTSVGLGLTFGVTVVYQQTAGWNQVYFLGGFNSNQSTFQACGTPNQIFDLYTGVNGSGNTASPPAGNGWGPLNPGGTGPATAVFTVTASGSLTPGMNYNYIIGVSGCDAQCGDLAGMEAQASMPISITLPPPSCGASVVSENTTAAPNGFFLFDVDYSFTNSGSSNVVCPLPANVTFQSAGPNAMYISGSNSVSWFLGNVGAPQNGVLWALVSINSGTSNGTVINVPSGTYTTANCGGGGSVGFPSSAAVTVQIPAINLLKSESAASLSAGQTVTYNLDWTATGDNLQMYDSYDNISSGTSTSGSAVSWGFDGTNYQLFPGPGPGTSLGTWTVQQAPQGDHYIEATVPYNSSGSGGNYPDLIRDVPGAEICDTIIVEGDLEIPSSAPGAGTGADAHMVIACNPSQGITLKAAISIDNTPGNLFVQKNNIYPLQSPSASMVFTTPFSIQAGQWYTMKSTVHSNGTGTTTFNIQLWPKGNPGSVVTLNYTDTFAPQPTCSGGWRAGWQADETAGTDWFSNLKVFGPGPILSAAVTDVVPAGVTYIGSDSGGVYNAGTSTISWNSPGSFPTTIYSFDTPINWWGTVACPGPIYNSFDMAANSIPATTSNTVTLTISGSCGPTPTPTNTPTPTPTATPSPTPACSSFTDSYSSSSSLSNYAYYDGAWNPSSAGALGWNVTGGEFQQIPGITYSYELVNNALFNQSLGDYTVEGDFMYGSAGGVFGLVFRATQGSPEAYIFQWNGINNRWEIEKQYAVGTYYYPSTNTSSPYVVGTWVHLKVTAGPGNLMNAWITPQGGPTQQIFTNVTDTGINPPYLTGAAGIRTYNIGSGNTLHVKNFTAYNCVGSPTPTYTPTPTPTATPTNTATITPTPVNTATFTSTPVGLNVWPNPFDTHYAVAVGPQNLPALQAYQVPLSAKMTIYTISGELVNTLAPLPTGYIYWYGTNSSGAPVAAGIYYYVIQDGNSKLLTGKVLLLRD